MQRSSAGVRRAYAFQLTRPGGRVQPVRQAGTDRSSHSFNPHPPRRASATTSSLTDGPSTSSGFNPHPPRRASATTKKPSTIIGGPAFQSSPAPEGECNLHKADTIVTVSILTRPGGIECNVRSFRCGPTLVTGFQSSPAPEGECNTRVRQRGPPIRFNPHPPRRASATSPWTRTPGWTLTFQSSPAPEGECNLRCVRVCGPSRSFNPHPPRRASATPRLTPHRTDRRPFQSSPAPEGECNDVTGSGQWGFNPHPPRRASATGERRVRTRSGVEVSILTRPGGRVQPHTHRHATHYTVDIRSRIAAVSILTRPGGRVQRGADTQRR